MNIWQINPKIRDSWLGNEEKPYTNSSLERSTNILLCLSNGINTNTEIAKYCNYSTSTVHRLLNVLKNLNWVVQDKINHKYYLGPVINHMLSNQADTHRYLLINSLQEMARLSHFSRETVSLSVMVQLRTVVLHFIPSEQELKIVEPDSAQGTQFAVGATARVLLSQLDEEEIKEVLSKVDILEISGKSTADRKYLVAKLMDIRRKGYGISYGERIAGAMCISAAVKNYSYPVALSILGPENRLKPRAAGIMEEIMAAASRISKSIVNTV